MQKNNTPIILEFPQEYQEAKNKELKRYREKLEAITLKDRRYVLWLDDVIDSSLLAHGPGWVLKREDLEGLRDEFLAKFPKETLRVIEEQVAQERKLADHVLERAERERNKYKPLETAWISSALLQNLLDESPGSMNDRYESEQNTEQLKLEEVDSSFPSMGDLADLIVEPTEQPQEMQSTSQSGQSALTNMGWRSEAIEAAQELWNQGYRSTRGLAKALREKKHPADSNKMAALIHYLKEQ